MPLNVGIVDHSIIGRGARESKIDLATPVNMYTAIRKDRRDQKLSELTLSKEEREQKRQAELQGIIQSSLTPEGSINSEKAIAGLNRGGFLDEAAAIQDRYQKAAEARRKAMEDSAKDMSSTFLSVAESKNPAEAFLLAKEDGQKKGWKMSRGLMEYTPSDEDIATGKINPKVMQELLYHGEKFLTPEQRIARAKAKGEAGGAEEYGLTPIYGKRGDKIVALQTSKAGGVKEIPLPEGIALTPGVTLKDLGGEIGIFDKSGAAVGSFAKGIDPGKKKDLEFKGEDLELKRAENARKEEEAAAKKVEVAKKARAYEYKNKAAIESLQTFLDKANAVKDSENMKYVTGAMGAARHIPGTAAADLQADIDFLVSSGVIETMTELKNQSPTGATGFGALSEKEMKTLQDAFSVLGNTKISPNKKRAEMDRVIKIMEKRKREQRILSRESNELLGPEPTEAEALEAEIDGL